MTFRI